MLHNSLSRAAKENMFQPGASVRWHDDEFGRNCLPNPANFVERRSATEHMAVRGRDAAFTCHLLEVFERGLFCVLLVCHEGKRNDGRSRRHKVCCVVKLSNMGQMY